MPVSMKSVGFFRRTGFIGEAHTGRRALPTGGGSSSSGRPDPENTRPSSSSPTVARAWCPVSVIRAAAGPNPTVSSKTCTTVAPPAISITCPRRGADPSHSIRTHSSSAARRVPLRVSSGPAAALAPR
jgi:hypothetical protein